MLLIPCPYCGLREEDEFDYGGPLRPLPQLGGAADATTWQRALHAGGNADSHPDSPLREIWYHASGCESWIALTRDMFTHEISDASCIVGRAGQQ